MGDSVIWLSVPFRVSKDFRWKSKLFRVVHLLC